jgi:hypothetical protein
LYCYLTITRYPTRFIPFALWSMAMFRIPLRKRASIPFFRLMGSGRSGSFDLQPDWHQWAILHFSETKYSANSTTGIDGLHRELYGPFITNWWRRFRCERWTICLELAEGHGTWDGYTPVLPGKSPLDPSEPVAVLTRATIRFSKLGDFWKRVGPISEQMKMAPGLRFSAGIGEAPVYRQATFSIWDSSEQMKAFAYRLREHRDVVRDTRTFKWYSEEMFLRFRPLFSIGSLRGRSIDV